MKNWNEFIKKEQQQTYFENINKEVEKSKQKTNVYPPEELRYNAFNTTPFEKVKVVIIGQDPYHNPGEAMGLSFSVPPGKKIPSSLRNMFKEMVSDLGGEMPVSGDLTNWANQGVMLLNTALSVEENNAGVHSKIGWSTFTDNVIKELSAKKENIVFLLWGAHARKKANIINKNKHLVLECAHPSGLSAHRGFLVVNITRKLILTYSP